MLSTREPLPDVSLNVDTMGAVTPTDEMLRLRRVAGAAARQWTDGGTSATRHNLRVARLGATWPQLAEALSHLADACASIPLDEIEALRILCPLCRSPLERQIIAPNPRTAEPQHTVRPCGHTLDREAALDLWTRGLPTDITPLSATALIAAEQVRQREEEGYTAEGDADLEPGALAWAAWCLLDRATSTRTHNDEVPTMWPLPPERWKPEGKTDTRLLIIAAALIASEIDARLSAGEAV